MKILCLSIYWIVSWSTVCLHSVYMLRTSPFWFVCFCILDLRQKVNLLAMRMLSSTTILNTCFKSLQMVCWHLNRRRTTMMVDGSPTNILFLPLFFGQRFVSTEQHPQSTITINNNNKNNNNNMILQHKSIVESLQHSVNSTAIPLIS